MIWWILGALAVGTTAAVIVSSSSPSDSAPTPFTDPTKYFAQIDAETKAIQNLKSNRAAENDARVQSWKKAAKYIPVVGDYAGYLIDLGNWLGKVLGSNYGEQNSQQDLDEAATWISEQLTMGFVPEPPRFTEKDGARNYNQGVAKTLEDLSYMKDEAGEAVRKMGLLTIANSANPTMVKAIADTAVNGGSLGIGSLYGKDGPPNIAAGVASSIYGVQYDELLKVAEGTPKSTRYSESYYRTLLNNVADVFINTMRYASDKKYGTAAKTVKPTDIRLAGRFDRSL